MDEKKTEAETEKRKFSSDLQTVVAMAGTLITITREMIDKAPGQPGQGEAEKEMDDCQVALDHVIEVIASFPEEAKRRKTRNIGIAFDGIQVAPFVDWSKK